MQSSSSGAPGDDSVRQLPTDEAEGQAVLSSVRCALSIGVNSYTGEHLWEELGSGLADAEEFKQAVEESLTPNVRLVQNPTRGELWNALEEWVDEMQEGTSSLLFYAGHGYESDGDFFLVPSDSVRKPDDVRLVDVMQLIDQRYMNCTVLFFIAACRDPPAEDAPKFRFPKTDLEARLQRYCDAARRRNEFLVSFACEPGETLEETPGLVTSYARFLASGIKEQKGIFEVLTQVSQQVREHSTDMEHPWFQTSLQADVSLHRTSSASASSSCSTNARKVSQEYSHFSKRASFGLSGGSRSRVQDIRSVWRTRIDRLTVRPNIPQPCLILLTDTQGQPARDVISHFEETGMGAHYLIKQDGHIVQFVDEMLCAWCGNPGYWGVLESHGEVSGIGPVNEVHNFGVSVALEGDGRRSEFRDEQYAALLPMLRDLAGRYDILPWNILGLAEVCMPPERYKSPGKHFDWQRLVDGGLTLNPGRCRAEHDEAFDLDSVKQSLEGWGYGLGPGGRGLECRLASFRDRYRTEQPMEGFKRSQDDVRALRGLLRERQRQLDEGSAESQADADGRAVL